MSRKFMAAGRFRTWIGATVLVVMALVVGQGTWAELTGPTRQDQQIAKIVGRRMSENHLAGRPVDREISHRALVTFLKQLDAQKLYFYQSDVDRFLQQEATLPKQLSDGDLSLAYDIFNVYLKRVDERVAMVDKLLLLPHDFSVDEDIIRDPKHATYPTNVDEAWDLWRRRIKFDLLLLKTEKDSDQTAPGEEPEAKGVTGQAAVERLQRKYHSFAKRMHQIDADELLEMFLTAVTSSYDPHSSYMSPGTLKNFEIQMKLELDGIGAQLQYDDGYTVVHEIVAGGAAFADGRLQKKDRIVGVGQGAGGDIVDVVDMKLSDVVALIRGKRGTIVRLAVIPVGKTEKKIYDITRAQIKLTDSEARGKVVETERDGHKFRIGVIDLPSFYMDMEGARMGRPDYKSTTRDVARILQSFREQKVDAVVLDLRRNGGGSLPEAVSLTGLFIDEGPVVQVKDRQGRVQPYQDQERGVAWDGPLVVLTSKFSASASEILAGAIQDYGRGIIVGDETTHGKGTVQSLVDLGFQLFQVPNAPALGALKLTIQQFYRPNGDSTQNRGVHADVVLPSLTNELDVGEADLDYALEFDRVPAAAFDKVTMVDRHNVERLQALSEQRCRDSQDFQKVLRNIARYHEQKNRQSITLNEAKFMAERAELDADKEEEDELQKAEMAGKEVFPDNFYNQEVLQVTLDYLQSIGLARRAKS